MKIEATRREVYENLTAWQRVQIARHIQRPFFLDYVNIAFTDFVELHGDRLFGDDASMPGGLATIGGLKCVVIGQQKGRDVKENLLRNFGCPHPEGYRKALRLMRMAEKFHLPVVTLIDTPGPIRRRRRGTPHRRGHCRESARDDGAAHAHRERRDRRGRLRRALGIGVSDRVLMLENAYYSVISPEGCAAILWKHRKHAPEAAEALKLNARELMELGVIDGVISEPIGGAHHESLSRREFPEGRHRRRAAGTREAATDKLLDQRYDKFRRMGVIAEEA